MGFMTRARSVAAMPRAHAGPAIDRYNQAFWSGDPLPDLWMSSLTAAGVAVSPDLAMTLSAYRCGVYTIGYDIATLPLRAFKNRTDGGKDLVVGGVNSHAAGIGSLIYKLQWQPNVCQTSVEFFLSMIAQFLMRNVGYAEIVPGPSGFMEQLLPRHPDRVRPERLPSGRLRFKLSEPGGGTRYVTQDEMFVIRDLSTDGGLSVQSRTAYGASAIGTGLAAERAAGKFFDSGMMAAVLATYTGGQQSDEQEAALHKSISRFAAGKDNSFGLMLVPDDVKVSNLAIEPDKAQMMLAREWTVFEVARDLRISPRKLMVRSAGTTGYGTAYQDSIDHVVNCLRPPAVLIQQSIQRDLVLAKDTYSFVFHLGELLKGDPQQMGTFIQQLIESRAMTPSEVRTTYLDMNPDPHLDQLSEGDNRPGTPKGQPATKSTGPSADSWVGGRVLFHAMMAVQDNAVRCIRRERAAIEKGAVKHANDPAAWQVFLRDFYADHAGFVAQTMRIPIAIARGFAGEHGIAFEEQGVAIIADAAGAAWEHQEAHALALLSVQTAERAA